MLKYIIVPLLGGIIGYITNELAIKMLFHPYRPLYIGKWHVPLTPGLIPSQKGRLAKSLGELISSHLLNADTLRREALSDANRARLRGKLERVLTEQAASEQTLRAALESHTDAATVSRWEQRAVNAASELVMRKLREADIGAMVAAQLGDSIRARLQPLGLARVVDGGMLDGLMGNISGAIEAKIEEKAPALIHEKLTSVAAEGLDSRICDAAAPMQKRMPALIDRLMEAYEGLLNNNLESLLRAAKLDSVIENKIASFDAAELERIVFSVMKRELNAIIYLGAALGFLMGFLNLLFV